MSGVALSETTLVTVTCEPLQVAGGPGRRLLDQAGPSCDVTAQRAARPGSQSHPVHTLSVGPGQAAGESEVDETAPQRPPPSTSPALLPPHVTHSAPSALGGPSSPGSPHTLSLVFPQVLPTNLLLESGRCQAMGEVDAGLGSDLLGGL